MTRRSLLGRLARQLPPGELVFTPEALAAHAGDKWFASHLPEAVALPASVESVSRILAFASKHQIPVTPRGAGHGYVGGCVPVQGGIALSVAGMNRVLEISAADFVAVVQPGVVTAALQEAVERQGLYYPPDPASRGSCFLGGNLAECAGGPKAVKYGVTKDYVLNCEVVLPTGEIIWTGANVLKNSTGYNLTQLLVGSEGTLAVFTEITVALAPRPEASKYGVAYFEDLAAAAGAVEKIITAGILPATLEFLDNTCLVAVEDFAHLGLDTKAGALLLFGDDGDLVTIEQSVSKMAEIAKSSSGCRGVTLAADVAAAEALLYARRCSLPALARLSSLSILEDIAVPRKSMAEAVTRIEAIGVKHGLRIGTFGHAGDGNLHPTIVLDKDNPKEVAAAEAALAEIFALPLEFGGTITGEHGVGSAKLPYLEAKIGPANMQLQRNIKKVFDPAGILNPGRIGS